MHGIIMAELKTFVETRFGANTWNTLVTSSGAGFKIYLPMLTYPDEEAQTIISGVAARMETSVPDFLEKFGEEIAPNLIRMYPHLVRPDWKTLDLIEHTEETIHKVVRIRNPGADPPRLKCARPTANEAVITYNSSRKMCAMVKGIVKGLGKHFHQAISIHETRCMLTGDPACEIHVTLQP